MSTITVETECGTTKRFDNHRDAERGKRTHEQLCDECDEEDVRIEVDHDQTTLRAVEDGGQGPSPEGATTPDRTQESVPTELPDSVRTDPLEVVPEYMISEVEGRPTITKRGYAVIANHFDIAVQAEPITTAGETDHEYAEFRATAWTKEDGPEHGYTGVGTARASEDRRGIEHNLNEMAETRAMKRAVAWASGVGLLAWEEMAEYAEEGR